MIGLLFLILVILIFLIKSRYDAYRKLQGCGFPVVTHFLSPFGYLRQFISGNAHMNFETLSTEYGKTVGVMLGGVPAVVTSDVELINNICHKGFANFHSRMQDPLGPDVDNAASVHMFAARGTRWKRLRTIISSSISQANMRRLYPMIEDSAKFFVNSLEKLHLEEPLDMHSLFQNHTSDVLARCAFGQLECCQNNNQHFHLFESAFGAVPRISPSLELLYWLLPELRLLLLYLKNLLNCITIDKSPIDIFTEYLISIIQTRTAFEERPDFMQNFKNTEDPNWNKWKTNNGGPVNVSTVKFDLKMTPGVLASDHLVSKIGSFFCEAYGSVIDLIFIVNDICAIINKNNKKEEVIAQSRFISIAGFDTTANSLIYSSYLLAKHPGFQEELHSEIVSLQEVTFESIASLTLLNVFICETLRLFPHASPLHNRKCMDDCVVNGIRFRSGVNVLVDTWTVHRDKEIWGADAEQFNPYRFLDPNVPWKAWMPFGVGPRQCVGMRFALLELKITLCHFIKKFRILPTERELVLSLRDTGTVWPENLRLSLQKRVA